MDFGDKVVGYLPVGQHEREVLHKGTILIRAAKQEIAFRKLADRVPVISRFCSLTATDPLVRMMLFQKPRYKFVPSHSYPLAVEYPVFLDKDDAFLSSGSLNEQSKIVKLLTEKREDARAIARESSSSVVLRFIRILFEHPSFRNNIISGKPMKGEDADKKLQDAFEDPEDQVQEMIEDHMEFHRANAEVLRELNPVLDAISLTSDAIHNHSILAATYQAGKNENAIADAIAKIEGLRGIRITYSSVCLECRVRNNLDSSIMIELNPRVPRVRTSCTKCSGTTILTRISLGIPPDMIQVFHENRIQEFAIGYTVAQSPLIERVYIHKKVSPMINGNEQSGKEVDILAISKDKRALAVEVTTTHRQSSIPGKASNKRDALTNLPLDCIFYVSADPTISEQEEHSPNTIVMGPQQIVDIDERITEYLSTS